MLPAIVSWRKGRRKSFIFFRDRREKCFDFSGTSTYSGLVAIFPWYPSSWARDGGRNSVGNGQILSYLSRLTFIETRMGKTFCFYVFSFQWCSSMLSVFWKGINMNNFIQYIFHNCYGSAYFNNLHFCLSYLFFSCAWFINCTSLLVEHFKKVSLSWKTL